MKKMMIYGSVAVLLAVQLLLPFCVFASGTEEALFEASGARELIYIEEYDIYAMVGGRGMYVSSDGLTWHRKILCDKGQALNDIAYGDDMGILIKNSSDSQTVFVTDAGLNYAEDVYPVTTDGEKYYNLVLRPEIVYDSYTNSFLCGGLEVRTTGYTNIGLYRSVSGVETGELPAGNQGKRMLWEKIDLGEYDLYNPEGVYNTSQDFVYEPLITDGNGHFAFGRIRAASADLDKFKDRLTDVTNYLRLLIVMDETGEELRVNRFNIGGIYTGVFMDKYGNLVYSKDNSSVYGSIFAHKFEKTLSYAKDASNAGTEIKNVNGRLAAMYANTFASNGTYLLSVPRQYIEPTAAQPQNDIQIINYNGEELEGTSTTLINNSETLKKILSAENRKWTCKIVAGKDGKFVMATGVSPYYNSASSPTKIFCFDLSNANISSGDISADEVDRSAIVTEVTVGECGLSALTLDSTKENVSIGETVALTAAVYDSEMNQISERIAYSVIDWSDNATDYLDLSSLEQDGTIRLKNDVLSGAFVWVRVLARSENFPWLFTVKKVNLNIANPVIVSVTADKTGGFTAGETITAAASITNTSSRAFEGYLVCFIKDGYSYSNFTLRPLNISAGESISNLDMSFVVDDGSGTDGTLHYYLLEKSTMSILGN